MVDWNLSQKSATGEHHYLVWRTEDGDEEVCIGSIDELT
jgi:hypothetical protein